MSQDPGHHRSAPTVARLVFSADQAYRDAAIDEVREMFPDLAAVIGTPGPDLGSISLDGLAIAGLASACRSLPSLFIRHLFREVGHVTTEPQTALEDVVSAALDTWLALPVAAAVALQVWTSGSTGSGGGDLPALGFRPDELWHALRDALAERGIAVARGGREQVLSACITDGRILLGLNSASNALSDWPGGRVRLARPRNQISRSEFKLEELFRITDPGIPASGIAIDLGASPGGWTRILRQRGFVVWAIDPAALDRRLGGDPDVHHVRTTAGPYLATSNLEADLVVNDMRMSPDLSAQVMLAAARNLVPGGWMIQTLKITPHAPVRTVREALARLETAYEIVFAHQLHHNRNEVTVVGRRRA